MGKTLVIKGADFSAVKVGVDGLPVKTISTGSISGTDIPELEATGNTTNYTSSDGYHRGVGYGNTPIPIGAQLKFADQSLWSQYKIALSKTVANGTANTGTWDQSYTGTAYIRSDVTITTAVVYVYIVKVDSEGNAVQFTDADAQIISENLFYKI